MNDEIFKYSQDVEWSLPVLFQQEFIWTAMYKELKNIGLTPPKVNAFGSPMCTWAGGRIPVANKPDFRIMRKVFEYMKSCNATPTFTFTYTGIEKEHLKDAYCNELLDFALEYNSKFIVFSDRLRDYIKEKSPNAFVTASVIKATFLFQDGDNNANYSPEKETEYYNKLLKEYDRVVVRPEYSRSTLLKHPEYIDDISKIEVLINQTCLPNCPWAIEHYKLYEEHRNGMNPKIKPYFLCYKTHLKDAVNIYKMNLIHTPSEVSKLVEHGVRTLKLQGRGELRPQFLLRLYSLYTQMFNIEGDGYMLITQMTSGLEKEMQFFNSLIRSSLPAGPRPGGPQPAGPQPAGYQPEGFNRE